MDSYRRCVFVYFFASFLTLLSYRAMPADLLEEAPNVTASAGPILAEDTARLLSLGTFCPSRSHSEHQGCKNRQSFTSRAHHGCHFGLDRTALCKHNANGASHLRTRTTGARTSSTRRSQDRTYRQQQRARNVDAGANRSIGGGQRDPQWVDPRQARAAHSRGQIV